MTLFGRRVESRGLMAAFVGCFRYRSAGGNMGMGTLGLGVSPGPENSELWRVKRGWPEVVWGLEPWEIR